MPDTDSAAAAGTAATTGLRLRNIAAAAVVVALGCAAYLAAPYQRSQLDTLYGWTGFVFRGRDFLVAAAGVYLLLLAVFHLCEPQPRASKSLQFLRIAAAFARAPAERWRRRLSRDERLALLATLLKAFYGPLMTMSLMNFSMGALMHGAAIVFGSPAGSDFRALFDRHGYWFLMQLFLFVDVTVFTVGYLVELPRLGNRIRSVDPTWLGWAAALACYPPFNHLTGAVLGSQVSDLPRFDDPSIHLALNFALLALMGGYAWTSLALGLKASNLTHRGIVARGPYRLVRHPAYVCKNLAWWIASVPLTAAAFAQSSFDGVQALASTVGWTMLYVLRALTEEDHLRSVDAEYDAYAARVKWRFVPGIV